MTEAGDVDEGITTIRSAIGTIRALGSTEFLTYFLGVLAGSLANVGRHEDAMIVVAEALEAVEASDERFYAAELHRVRGEALSATGHDPAKITECFRSAVELARCQHARVLEHRARASLQRFTS